MNAALARAMCEVVGRDCRVVIARWAEIREALEAGEIDAIVGMFYSESRDRVVDFSQPFARVQHIIVSPDRSRPAASVEDIAGRRIAVMSGDLMHDYALENGVTTDLLLTETVAGAVEAVATGEAEYALVARLPAVYTIRDRDLGNLEIGEPVSSAVPYSVATAHGRGPLLFALSDALAVLHADGTFDKIRETHLTPLETEMDWPRIMRFLGVAAIVLLVVALTSLLWVRSLRGEVRARTRKIAESEARIDHLNRVLLAIRNVNQLITQADNRVDLLSQGVRFLTETRGYLNAWVFTFAQSGAPAMSYESAVGKDFEDLSAQLHAGDYPRCVRKVLSESDLIETAAPSRECHDCPLARNYTDRGGLTAALRHGDRTYGVLCVSVPQSREQDPEEQGLVKEVAGDLAYALHAIAVEEEREKLADRLELAKRIVEESPVVLIRWRPEEGRPISYVSSNIHQFGYTVEELLSGAYCYSDIVHPDDRDRVAAESERYLREGRSSYTQEYRIVDPQGTERWVLDETTVTRNEGGTPVALDGVIQDIGDRKRHEHDLEFQSLILDQINDQIAVANLDGELTYVNSAQAGALGTTADQLIATHVSILGDDLEASGPENEMIEQTLRTGEWSGTVVRINASGNRETVRLRSNMLRSLSGDVVGMIFIGTDISELSRAQADVARGRARLKALFDSAQDIMYLQDARGVVTHANEALAAFLGSEVERVIGLAEVGLSDDRGRWQEEDIRVLAGSSVRSETDVTRAGRRRILETIRTPVFDLDGNIIGLCGVSRDVTESVESRSRLATMAREKEVLLRELYHRTKNNMQVVASMIALKRYGVTAPRTQALLQDLESRIYAIALVHQKLYQSDDLSRMDLADYLTELTDQIEASYGLRERGIRMETDLESTPAVIDQAVPIGLALNELLSNATKHAFVGRERGTISVGLKARDAAMVLTVEDDGVGAPDDALSESSGIGLQTLRALVEMQLGGAIECEVENGTRWILTIPTRAHDTTR